MLNKYVQKVHANKGFQPAQKAKKKKLVWLLVENDLHTYDFSSNY